MATTINSLDCITTEYGTNLRECILRLGQPEGVIKTPINWSLNLSTETFDALSYVQGEIQKGNYVPFLESFGFTDNTGDNTYQESEDGNESFVRSPNPKFNVSYDQGMYYSKILQSHKSGKCGIIFVFKNNVFAFAESTDGTSLKPFRANHFSPTNFKLPTGSTSSMVSVDVQLRDAEEWNAKMTLIQPTTFDHTDINGFIDVDILLKTTPVDTDTSIQVRVHAKWNPDDSIALFSPEDFKITGKTIDAVAYNADTELYTISLTGTFDSGDTYNVKLNDGAYDSVLVETQLFKGKSETVTVA